MQVWVVWKRRGEREWKRQKNLLSSRLGRSAVYQHFEISASPFHLSSICRDDNRRSCFRSTWDAVSALSSSSSSSLRAAFKIEEKPELRPTPIIAICKSPSEQLRSDHLNQLRLFFKISSSSPSTANIKFLKVLLMMNTSGGCHCNTSFWN